MTTISITMPLGDPKLAAVLTALGISPAMAPATPPPVGSSVDMTGLAVLDDHGAAVVADQRNASAAYLAGLRLLASRSDVSEAELLAVVGATTLAGHKAATSKRASRAVGRTCALFRTEGGRTVMVSQTRQALARFFGISTTTPTP